MPTYVIAYRAPKDYEPGDAGDMAAWDAWRHSMGDKLRDFGNPVRDTTQIGDCGATQRFRGYSIITADDLESAVAMAKGCPGLAYPRFGIEVGLAQDMDG
jgi:hypothetical protein